MIIYTSLEAVLKVFSKPRSGRKKVARDVKRLVKFAILFAP
jgi:hypothetical protein